MITHDDILAAKQLKDAGLTGFNYTMLLSSLKAQYNPTFEFPPTDAGIPQSSGWTKDMSDLYTSWNGLGYAKYKFTATNSTILNGTYIAYSSSIFAYLNSTSYNSAEWAPSGAFDKRLATGSSQSGWHQDNADTTTTRELFIQLPRSIFLKSYSIQYRSDGGVGHQISNFNISGSNDGKTWTLLDVRQTPAWALGEVRSYNASFASSLFSVFRYSTSLHPAAAGVHVAEWRLFGSFD